jgi:hypothetical protein
MKKHSVLKKRLGVRRLDAIQEVTLSEVKLNIIQRLRNWGFMHPDAHILLPVTQKVRLVHHGIYRNNGRMHKNKTQSQADAQNFTIKHPCPVT